jgi:hypothetical protein
MEWESHETDSQTEIYQRCNEEADWLAFKIYQTKDSVSHNFGYYLVGYQNLLTSHI